MVLAPLCKWAWTPSEGTTSDAAQVDVLVDVIVQWVGTPA